MSRLKILLTVLLVASLVFITLFITSLKVIPNVSTNASITSVPILEKQLSEYRIVELVNEYRASKGLNRLILDPESNLCDYTRIRAEETSIVWEHNDKYHEIYQKVGYVYYGENLAKDYTSEENVVRGWLNSPSHLENMERPEYTHTCVAIQDNNYVVQLFASY